MTPEELRLAGFTQAEIEAHIAKQAEKDAAAPASLSMGQKLAAGALNFANEFAFGGLDEAAAALNAGIDEIGQLVGLAEEKEFGERYDNYLNTARGAMSQFREEMPVTSTVSGLAGALLSPGPKGKLHAGQRLVHALLEGGTRGFLAGEGDLADRAGQAAKEGGMSLAIAVPSQYVSKFRPRTKLSKAGSGLEERMAGATPEEMGAAADMIEEASESGQRLFLHEALPEKSVVSRARALANTPGIVENKAARALRGRADGAADRVAGALDGVSLTRGVEEGSEQIATRAAREMDAAQYMRARAARPYYKQAAKAGDLLKINEVNPSLVSEGGEYAYTAATKKLRRLLKVGRIEKQVNSVLNDMEGPASPSSFNVLDQVYRSLRDEAMDLKARGYQAKGARVGKLARELSAEMDKLVELKTGKNSYKMARGIFENKSAKLTELERNKFEVFTKLLDPDKPGEVSNAGRKLLSYSGKTLQQMRKSFGRNGEKDFLAGIRAGIEDRLATARDGADAYTRVLGKKADREKLRLAMGDKRYAKLERFLKREKAMTEGKRAVFEGSSSHRNFLESPTWVRSVWRSVVSPSELMLSAFERLGARDKLAEPMADIMFDPKSSAELLRATQARALEAAQEPAVRQQIRAGADYLARKAGALPVAVRED